MAELAWFRGAPESHDAACFALRSSRVVLAAGEPREGGCDAFEVVAATVVVREGRIVAVFRDAEEGGSRALPEGCVLRDCGDTAVLPGLVDAGARFGECGGLPAGGDSDAYEGFALGTMAAAAGGISTTVDLASRDAEEHHANDVDARAALAEAARIHVDVALGCRLPASPASGAPAVARHPRCVALEAFLTPPTGACGSTCAEAFGRCCERRRDLSRRPLVFRTNYIAAEDLEAASPYRLLGPADRREAKSPLLLLPFCQVDPNESDATSDAWSPRTGRETGDSTSLQRGCSRSNFPKRKH